MTNRSLLRELAGDLTGEISFTEGNTGFQRPTYYSEFDGRDPLAVATVADADDVSRIIGFSRDTGVPLAVRAGGHSVLGHSVIDGGVIVDLSALGGVEIDPDAGSAWVGGGVLAGEYTRAAGEHGMATGFGDTASVGVAGLTLGGGVGLLHRKLGLTIDNLLAAEIVTADGELRQIDEENDPDLFWAIRGGGGNFGVVTRLRFQLHPVDQVLGGMLILPASPRLIADLVTVTREASDDLSMIAGVAVAPPLPFLPKEVHGQHIVFANLVHAGGGEVAEREVDRIRSLAPPLLDGVKETSYPSIFETEDAPHPAAISIRSVFSDDLSIEDAEAVIDTLTTATADMNVVQIRVLGGAVARVSNDATAFGHRDRAMILNVAAAYQEQGRRSEHETWVAELSDRLAGGSRGAYINFLGDDSLDAVRAAYPPVTWERLVDVKKKYDPFNLFTSNHNIPPGG